MRLVDAWEGPLCRERVTTASIGEPRLRGVMEELDIADIGQEIAR